MRSVTYLKTHSIIFVPTLGALGDTLTTKGGTSKSLELDMTTSTEGVFISVKGHTILVPYGNIVLAVVGPEILPSNPAAQVSAPSTVQVSSNVKKTYLATA